MHFSLVDLHNERYNPNGTIDPANFRFPFAENLFDFAFAYSIFTHLLPPVTVNYLHEIHRVLKPGKKALLTCTLLDGYPETLRADIIETRALVGVEPLNGIIEVIIRCSIRKEPEKVTAYQRGYFLEQVSLAGLEVVETYNGCWSELENYLSEQDIVIVAKPAI
jgi:SAM-dependent methyltransferase